MSSPMAHPIDLASSFPALDPEISADVTGSLIAAVTGPADAGGQDDSFGRETTLIAELDAFHPRDLEETVLVAQLLAAHHGAMTCFRAAGQCEVTGKEASRMRRDAIALQRSLLATVRALHKSQVRPVSEDELVPRPVVPIAVPRQAARPQPAHPRARPDNARPAAGIAVDDAGRGNAEPEGGASAQPAAPAPKRRSNPFEGHPDLQRLNDRWDSLPPWEQMTMEERRETFGYKYERQDAADPAGEAKS